MRGSTLTEKVLGRQEIIIVFPCNLRDQQMEIFIPALPKAVNESVYQGTGKKGDRLRGTS